MAKNSVITAVQFEPRYDRAVILVFRKMYMIDMSRKLVVVPKKIEHQYPWNENILHHYQRFLKMIKAITFRQINDHMIGFGYTYQEMCYFDDGEIKPGYVMLEENNEEGETEETEEE